ncbi:MAG: SsrA-binding protein SmpB [Chlamydiota bacterium]|nr:SsrA-binding protein SmpB [Chlamydiota bacterium]
MSDNKLVSNRKARHDYTIMETFEAGVVLKGTEIKSLRLRNANFQDCYGRIAGGELYLEHFHISPYEFGNIHNHEPLRSKKLLLHSHQIKRLIGLVSQKGYTLVPLTAYLKRGRVKIEMALAKGKHTLDKREALKKKAHERDAEQVLKGHHVRF